MLFAGIYCGFCGKPLEGPLKTCKNCGNTMCETCLTEHERSCHVTLPRIVGPRETR